MVKKILTITARQFLIYMKYFSLDRQMYNKQYKFEKKSN